MRKQVKPTKKETTIIVFRMPPCNLPDTKRKVLAKKYEDEFTEKLGQKVIAVPYDSYFETFDITTGE